MESFDDLGVSPDLVEALAGEGIEGPTAFQEMALPVLLRGNSLVAQAGPGGGTLVAYGIPLLQAVDPEAAGPRGLVLCPTPQGASRLAESLSRLAQVTGHRVAALGSPWVLPELASILFATPEDTLREVRSSHISLEEVESVVVDGYGAFLPPARESLETLLEILPREGQRILLALPLTPEAEAFARAHLHRAVHLPPRAAQLGLEDAPLRRGEVSYRVTGETKDGEVLQTVARALEEGARHVLLFSHSDDQAADLGDFLALHGYLAGAPGDGEFPIWLSARELEARKVLDAWPDPTAVVTVSVDVPSDPDSLDRRHGGREAGTILVRSREIPHLKDVGRRTGYKLIPVKEPPPTRVAAELERLRDLLERTLREEDLAPHYLALEPLYQDYAPGEVAAAALLLLQRRQAALRPLGAEAAQALEESRPTGPPPKTWVRLFVAVGEKDGVGPGDLLGAIAGEAGVEGSQVGKIEIRDTFSLVEVMPAAADLIIRSLNGTTIRGRAVRVDYDRGGTRGRSAPPPRGAPQGRGGPPGRSGPGRPSVKDPLRRKPRRDPGGDS